MLSATENALLSPLPNSKRCLKASTLFCKIEAFKLISEPKVEVPRSRPCSILNDV